MHMAYLVSITSQGQISIPARIRKALGLERFRKAFIALEDSKIIIEPVSDVLSLKGTLSYKAKKLPISQIIKEEKKALSGAIAQKYKQK